MFVILNAVLTETGTGNKKIFYLAAIRVDDSWNKTDGIEIALSEDAAGTGEPYLSYYRRGASDRLITERSERGILRQFTKWLRPGDVFCVYDPTMGRAISDAWHRVFRLYPPYSIVFAGPKICRLLNIIKERGQTEDLYFVAEITRIYGDQHMSVPMNEAFLLQSIARKLGIYQSALIQDNTRQDYYSDRKDRSRAMLLKSTYNYVFLPGSEVFHTKYCHCVLRSDDIKGCVYYENAAEGRRPCKICSPVPGGNTGKAEAEKARTEGKPPPPAGHSQVITVSLLGGKHARISKSKIVGCCHSKLHPGKLTKALMDEHDCINKECVYFEKYEDSPYWTERRRIKAERKRNKQKKKELEASKYGEEAAMEKLRDIFQTVSDETCSDMLIVRVKKEAYIFEIYYVSDNPFADGNRFPDFLAELKKQYPKNRLILRHIKDIDGSYVTREEYYRLKRRR